MQPLDLEKLVRDEAGLLPEYQLHPSFPHRIAKQDEAINFLKDLLSRGIYEDRQVGLFARDLGANGAKTFFVDTYAGLALESSRQVPPCLWSLSPNDGVPPLLSRHEKTFYSQSFYEVVADGKPCWLYFDLEFNRIANPWSDPDSVACEFYRALDRFLISVLGSPHDADAVVELDSTTPEKFSKHVIVKKLQNGEPLAFSTNTHAGVLVTMFIEHLRTEMERDRESVSQSLFFNDAVSEADQNSRLVPLIDGCVYSRNRCFRLVFSSKFEKYRPLLMSRGKAVRSLPPLQLLSSFASFVPAETVLFDHPQVPHPLEGVPVNTSRGSTGQGGTKPSRKGAEKQTGSGEQSGEGMRGSFVRVAVQKDSPYFLLFDFLIGHWDQVRSTLEPGTPTNTTRVQSGVLIGEGRYLCLTLAHNRFCLRKGASHKSNSIYFVVDLFRRIFYQKCHDVVDCGRDIHSEEYALPEHLLHLCWEEEPVEMTQVVLSQVVEDTQALLSHNTYLCDMLVAPTLLVSSMSSQQNGVDLAETLHLCGSSLEPTLVTSTPLLGSLESTLVTYTPLPKQASISQHAATPGKLEAPTLVQHDLNVPKPWHREPLVSPSWSPTMIQETVETQFSETLVQKTQLDVPSESEPGSLFGTEIDSDCLESVASEGLPIKAMSATFSAEVEVASRMDGPEALGSDECSGRIDALWRDEVRTAASCAQALNSYQSMQCVRNPTRPIGRTSVYDQLWDSDDDEIMKVASVKRHLGELSNQLWSGTDGCDDGGSWPCKLHAHAKTEISDVPLFEKVPRVSSRAEALSSLMWLESEVDGLPGRGNCSRLRSSSSLESVSSQPSFSISTDQSTTLPRHAKKRAAGRCRQTVGNLDGNQHGDKTLPKRARAQRMCKKT